MTMEIGLTKLSTKGQIIIPKNIRQDFDMEKNDSFVIFSQKDEITIKRVKDVFKIKRKNNKMVTQIIKAIRNEKILENMENGNELSLNDVFGNIKDL